MVMFNKNCNIIKFTAALFIDKIIFIIANEIIEPGFDPTKKFNKYPYITLLSYLSSGPLSKVSSKTGFESVLRLRSRVTM